MPALFKKAPLVAAIALATTTSLSYAQQLEEVIVTAQKRAESLQDVPISVSAMQGDKIQEAGIPNMAALADYVPNLHIANAPVNTNIYMRGMGSGNNQGFEQSVGMYIDGIYMGRGRQYRSPFLDVQRVEVLRGPQGTLFGKNTVAGAINIITASPDVGDEFEGEVAVSAESFDGLIVEGYVSGTVTDNLALRFAAKYRETDGYAENKFLNDDEPNIEDQTYRFTAVWQPTDTLNINVKYSNSTYDIVGSPSTTKLYLDPAARDALVPNRSAFADSAYAVNDTFYPELVDIAKKDFTTFKDNNLGQDGKTNTIGKNPDSSENDVDNFAMNIDWDIGEHTLTSVTGWSAYDSTDGVDVDWLPVQFISRDDDSEFEQFSQEFRLTSPGGEFFDYVVGAYYEESTLKSLRAVDIDTSFDGLYPEFLSIQTGLPAEVLPQNLLSALTGGAYDANQIARNHKYEIDADSWAVFGQGTFNISDTWRVTLGLRYTEETKAVKSSQFVSDSNTGIRTPSDNFFLAFIQAGTFNTYTYDYDVDRDTDALLPSMVVQWDVSDDSMLYLSLSQGFKSGGFTGSDDGEPAGFIPGQTPIPGFVYTEPSDEFEFDDENVDALEIGGKHTLLDGGMTLNWAYFYSEYEDLQTSVFKGVGFGVTNAASSEVQGIEVDMMWQVTDGLRLGANAAWLDAEFADYKDGPCTAIQLDVDPLCGTSDGFTSNDLSGEPTTYASEYSAAMFYDYSYIMGGGMEIFTGGDVNWRDSFNPSGDNDPVDQVDSYYKVNLRLGLRGDSWEVMAYGRNILDEEVFSQSFDVPVLAGSHAVVFDEGAVYGVRAKYMF